MNIGESHFFLIAIFFINKYVVSWISLQICFISIDNFIRSPTNCIYRVWGMENIFNYSIFYFFSAVLTVSPHYKSSYTFTLFSVTPFQSLFPRSSPAIIEKILFSIQSSQHSRPRNLLPFGFSSSTFYCHVVWLFPNAAYPLQLTFFNCTQYLAFEHSWACFFPHSWVSWSKHGPYSFQNTFLSSVRNLSSSVFRSGPHCDPYTTVDRTIIVMCSWISTGFERTLELNRLSNAAYKYLFPNWILCWISMLDTRLSE